jgi:DNA-binding NtrC family response regulator
MPIELQVKLLRVLETNSMNRVGGEQPIQVDVRILAASNRNVQQAIDEGKLRPDLYYRLKVFQIDLAPLRDRRDDIKLLAQAFLEDLIQSEGRAKRFSDRAFEMLAQYNWPGNVRELRNVVHFAYVLSEELIDVDSLPAEVQRGGRLPEAQAQAEAKSESSSSGTFTVRVGSTIAEVERRLILATLREYQEDKPKSANVLGISLKTLYNRLNQYQAPEGNSGPAGPDEQAANPRANEVEVVP